MKKWIWLAVFPYMISTSSTGARNFYDHGEILLSCEGYVTKSIMQMCNSNLLFSYTVAKTAYMEGEADWAEAHERRMQKPSKPDPAMPMGKWESK